MDSNCETLLDSLNEDCLLMIFKLLEFEDLMSVAETCTKFKDIANFFFKKHLAFDSKLFDYKRAARILRHTGPHITSLEIRCSDQYPCSRLLNRIDCTKLKHLSIQYLKLSCLAVFSTRRFNSLETLTLTYIKSDNLSHLRTLVSDPRELKRLSFLHTDIEVRDLEKMLRNNPNLESLILFGAVGADFDFQLLELIPKVQKLAFRIAESNNFDVHFPPALDCLTTLQINCQRQPVNKFLKHLTQKPLLKELELHLVPLDGLFSVITEFVNLEVLHLCSQYDNETIPAEISSIDLPPNIKQLLLRTDAWYSRAACVSTIRKLESLERFDGNLSFGSGNADVIFKNIAKLLVNRKQKLHLGLVWYFRYTFGGRPSEYERRLSIESAQLKIFQCEEYEDNPMGIHARFPVSPRRVLNCDCCTYEAKKFMTLT